MNRHGILLGGAIACMGCAAGVEDPQPEPMATEPQREPPRRPLYGDLQDPFGEVVVDLDDYRPDLDLPPQQLPGHAWPRTD